VGDNKYPAKKSSLSSLQNNLALSTGSGGGEMSQVLLMTWQIAAGEVLPWKIFLHGGCWWGMARLLVGALSWGRELDPNSLSPSPLQTTGLQAHSWACSKLSTKTVIADHIHS
jgi:hypothetical protein